MMIDHEKLGPSRVTHGYLMLFHYLELFGAYYNNAPRDVLFLDIPHSLQFWGP